MIDPDKLPDRPLRVASYRGVKIESRYGKQHEIDTMMRAVDYLLAGLAIPGDGRRADPRRCRHPLRSELPDYGQMTSPGW